ncbi:rRNA maturation RNase YbeY [Galenea microaerophila]
MIELEMQWAIEPQPIPTFEQAQQWGQAALLPENQPSDWQVTLRIVDPNEIQTLNRTYRQKDRPTNVLSFPFEQPVGLAEPVPYLGDLVVCAEVVAQEAHSQQKSLTAHWAHMVVHGMLHLQELDHMTEAEAEQMEALEIQILSQLGFENPYLLKGASTPHE